MDQNERVKEFKLYEKKITEIIQYYRDRQNDFKNKQTELSQRIPEYIPKYAFVEFCSWMNEGKSKTKYEINGWSSAKLSVYRTIIDELYSVVEKENTPTKQVFDENSSESAAGAYKMTKVLSTYQSYLDFLYKKYIILIDQKIKYGEKSFINLDNIDIDKIVSRINKYIENLKQEILFADKEENIEAKKKCVEKYEDICNIFESVYQEYCEEKERRSVPRNRKDKNNENEEELVETEIKRKEVDKDGNVTIYGYTKKVPKSELEQKELENSQEGVKVEIKESDEKDSNKLPHERILDNSSFTLWCCLTEIVGKLPIDKRIEAITKMIEIAMEVK